MNSSKSTYIGVFTLLITDSYYVEGLTVSRIHISTNLVIKTLKIDRKVVEMCHNDKDLQLKVFVNSFLNDLIRLYIFFNEE